ncbi:MAG TPA: heavy metal sensor histidine kinase [Steroidobacteraceae bacterium]|nr:heavy metal sensor histidine kinase [Steroidobacteraceae bacterium]
MSSSKAKARRSRPAWSIATRLTVLYALTSSIAVAAFIGALYWMMAANFRAEHIRFLQSKAHELTEDFHDDGDRPAALIVEIDKETATGALGQYRARVLGSAGRAVGDTPSMGRALPASLFPAPTGADDIGRRTIEDRYVAGRHLVLAAFRLAPVGSAGRGYVVQLALDATRDDALLADYRRGLLMFLLLLVPVWALAGRFVTRRGLEPLRRISEAARAVTPARLAERIPLAPPWPPELAELVGVFNGMIARLEEAFNRLSRFSADLAHELRTPLNNLMGETEVCLSRPRTADEYRAALSSGLEECRRLTQLIENLLFIARAEETGRSVALAEFEAGEICERVIEFHAAAAADRGIRLASAGSGRLRADPVLFRQALSNLLANAIRHSPPGGEVRVGIEARGPDGIDVVVADRGAGIAPEHLPHVFDRFYQVDPARAPRGQGTGLGLSIVKSIMALHGGTVFIESDRGAGTRATLRFAAGGKFAAGGR